jgi:hypothetical protein
VHSHAAHLRTLRVSMRVIHTILAPSMQPSSFRACRKASKLTRQHATRQQSAVQLPTTKNTHEQLYTDEGSKSASTQLPAKLQHADHMRSVCCAAD